MRDPEVIKKLIAEFMHLQDNDIVMARSPHDVIEVNPGSLYHAQLFARQRLFTEHSWLAMENHCLRGTLLLRNSSTLGHLGICWSLA